MNNEIKNLIWAIVLSTVILMAWQYFFVKPLPPQQAQQQGVDGQAPGINPGQITAPPSIEVEAKPIDREEAIALAPSRVAINNDKVRGSISTRGTRFDDLILKGYRTELAENSPDFAFLNPSKTENVNFAQFGWIAASGSTVAVPDSNTVWQSSSDSLEPGKPLVMTWDNGQGLVYKKKIEIDENYMFKIEQSVQNNTGSEVQLAPYGLISRTKEEYQDFIISHEGFIGVFDGVLHNDYTFNDILDDFDSGSKQSMKGITGWFGMADKYWSSAIIPDKNNKFDMYYGYSVKNGKPQFQTEFVGSTAAVLPGQSYSTTQNFYAGAKKVSLLKNYEEEQNITLFSRSVDFGWLYFITEPIFHALHFFYGFLGNFGLAIMLLTVCIKLAMFPLANKGYRAMNKLKALQPQMVEMKERYKDDKVKLQQEMMAMYKKEKVNPVSGCFPILIQLPIFFCLYKVLFITIEMRHAPFYGWINDLSAPDPTSVFNLFGYLPYEVPDWSLLQIGAWPIIMMVTMILQQKLNPPPPDPMQATMIKALPYVFVFLFAQFPAGLILYWAWSNSLSILQQWMLTRMSPPKEAPKGKK